MLVDWKVFIDNALLLCGKDIPKWYVEYHQNMKGEVFQIWKNTFNENEKNCMIEFMKERNITIPETIPTNKFYSALSEKQYIPKQYIAYNIAKSSGCLVLQVPPFH